MSRIRTVRKTEKREITFDVSDLSKLDDALEAKVEELKKGKDVVEVTYKPKSSINTVTIDSPIADAPFDAAFVIGNKTPQYYLKFGYLLEFIEQNIIPQIVSSKDDNPPLVNIDYDSFANKMYSLPNHLSLDPGVCLVRNDQFVKRGTTVSVLHELPSFRVIDFAPSVAYPNSAYIMKIYLNFNFIIESLNSNSDERGDVNLYGFLSSICTGLNKALGGINNLEPIIDETTNTITIIDSTPIPGLTSNSSTYTLQLYGYNKSTQVRGTGPNISFSTNYTSNFIRKVDLKTAITPEYATMVTVGATAGGYVKGVEATAFARWNAGLTDRFKEKLTPSNPNSKPKEGEPDEAETNYVEKYLSKFTECFGWKGYLNTSGIGKTEISSDIVSRNISVVTEYYKYLQSKNRSGGGTVGFIPFKLSLTMDGISGIKIYNKLHVDTRFLPSNYSNTMDLIVTGVSHKLSNNDWETEIEATVIPKTTQQNQPSIPDTVISETVGDTTPVSPSTTSPTTTSCSGIPRSNGLNPQERRILKERNINLLDYRNTPNTDEGVINFIRGKNEGGYFHPINYYSYDKPQVTHQDLGPGVSGETLWGEDRFAGVGNSTPKKREFWSIVDKYSGFGPLAEISLKHGKKSSIWNKKKSPDGRDFLIYKNRGWSKNTLKDINELPNFKGRNVNIAQFKKDLKRLLELKYEIPADSFYQQLDSNFSSYPQLKNLILSDVRTRYMWYRARYNGPLFFQNYAKNLIKVWNSGERNLDKLICADLTYRYNYNKGKTYESDILRTVDYVIPNR
jgi:hypothetical protein